MFGEFLRLNPIAREADVEENARVPEYLHRPTLSHLIRARCTVGQAVTVVLLVYAFWIGFAVSSYRLGIPEWVRFLVAAVAFLGYILFILNGTRVIRTCHRTLRRKGNGGDNGTTSSVPGEI